MISHEMKNTRDQFWHMAIHATQVYVTVVLPGACRDLHMALRALRVRCGFPFQSSRSATMHLMAAQTAHPTSKAGALRLSRSVVIQPRDAAICKKTRTIMIARDSNRTK